MKEAKVINLQDWKKKKEYESKVQCYINEVREYESLEDYNYIFTMHDINKLCNAAKKVDN